MIFNKSLCVVLAAAALSAAANASTVFKFDGDTLGTSTTFTDTVNGLSATFSSTADPGGFVVYQSMFETLTGNVLGDPGPAGQDNLALSVNFSQNLSAVVLDFATSDFITPSPLTLTAYENSTLVGSNTLPGQFLPGFTFPEGEIAFDGAIFNQIVISSTATDFAVDNINVIPATAAPEPATCALLGAGLLALGIPAVRRKSARKAVIK
ncbi:MAG: hypothetical protein WBW33_16630 [Bryobacteraceae bacterium]